MTTFIGDYTVRLDQKGRLSFPSAFKRQIREGLQDGFVLKRDVFEPCLIIYPMEEWERQKQDHPGQDQSIQQGACTFSEDVFLRNSRGFPGCQ